MIGSFAIDLTMAFVTRSLTDTPTNTSASFIASSSERQSVLRTKLTLVLVERVATSFVHDALGVDHEQVLVLDAERTIELGAGDTGGTGAGIDDADIFDILADNFQRIDQRRGRNDRRAVLVIVEDRNVHRLLERLFNIKALRALDIFKVDAAERRLEELAALDHFRPDPRCPAQYRTRRHRQSV